MDHNSAALAIARTVAADLAPRTRGIALTGSVAAGTDHPDSDIDLVAVTDADAALEVRCVDGRMVTVDAKTIATIEAAFDRPWEAGAAVPGWRSARVLTDPEGLLTRVKLTAEAWDWSRIGARADRWAAHGLAGLAEEAHKTAGMLAAGNLRAAATNRSLLAMQLPGLLAAAGRLLYRTENDLWDLVCRHEGDAWTAAWDRACGLEPTDLATGCRAALTLYRFAADRLAAHCTGEEAAVVALACRVAARAGG